MPFCNMRDCKSLNSARASAPAGVRVPVKPPTPRRAASAAAVPGPFRGGVHRPMLCVIAMMMMPPSLPSRFPPPGYSVRTLLAPRGLRGFPDAPAADGPASVPNDSTRAVPRSSALSRSSASRSR